MDLAGLPIAAQIDLLTDGVPDAYRSILCSRDPQSLAEWIRVARNFEATRPAPKTDSRGVPVAVAAHDKSATSKPLQAQSAPTKRKYDDKPPSAPCPRCLASGKTEFHWMRVCPLPPTERTAPRVAGPKNGPRDSHAQ